VVSVTDFYGRNLIFLDRQNNANAEETRIDIHASRAIPSEDIWHDALEDLCCTGHVSG
jgi:hypothetical protein